MPGSSILQKVKFSNDPPNPHPFHPPVQNECIPNAILGNDVLCQAKSGMGKTAVFVIAILQQLPKKPDPVSALILCHTRELAYQINKEFVRLGKFLELKSKVFYGGEPITDQQKVLKNEPPHVVVGTPGRVLDLIQKGFLKLDNLRYFVLDECDKMLEQLGKFHFNMLVLCFLCLIVYSIIYLNKVFPF